MDEAYSRTLNSCTNELKFFRQSQLNQVSECSFMLTKSFPEILEKDKPQVLMRQNSRSVPMDRLNSRHGQHFEKLLETEASQPGQSNPAQTGRVAQQIKQMELVSNDDLLDQRLNKCVKIWFHPELGRLDTEAVLSTGGSQGNFIVRTSSRPNAWKVLTILDRGGIRCKHVPILKMKMNYCLHGSKRLFTTLNKLLVHYTNEITDFNSKIILPQQLMTASDFQLEKYNNLGLSFWTFVSKKKKSDSIPISPPTTPLKPRTHRLPPLPPVSLQIERIKNTQSPPPPSEPIDILGSRPRTRSNSFDTGAQHNQLSALSAQGTDDASQPGAMATTDVTSPHAGNAYGELWKSTLCLTSMGQHHVYAIPYSHLKDDQRKMSPPPKPPRMVIAPSGGDYCEPWDKNPILGMLGGPLIESGDPYTLTTQSLTTELIDSGEKRRRSNAWIEEDDQSSVDEDFRDRVMPFSITTSRPSQKVGCEVRRYLNSLVANSSTETSQKITSFVNCTLTAHNKDPVDIMRNVRQFMNGFKNHLMQMNDPLLKEKIDKERNKLAPEEFLNLDAIFESILQRLVLYPLRKHVKILLAEKHNANGSVLHLSRNIQAGQTKTSEELGVKSKIRPPEGQDLDKIENCFRKMEKAYSPLKKLESLLSAIEIIYKTIGDRDSNTMMNPSKIGADDFLPVFVYVMIKCKLLSAEIEAEYIEGLLHPSLLAGEGGYYLTTLQSAVQVVKSLVATQPRLSHDLTSKEIQGVMRILILDEGTDNVIPKSFPVRPNLTTKALCNMIANSIGLYNPNEYGLFLLSGDSEELLSEDSFPQRMKDEAEKSSKPRVFLFRRRNALYLMSQSFCG